MAWDPASRLLNSIDQPRPAVPSRTSSLRSCQSSPADAKLNNCIAPLRPVRTNTLSEAPTSPCAPAPSVTTRHALAIQDDASLAFVHCETAMGPTRTPFATNPSPRADRNRRSASCAPPMRNAMRTAKVKRWAGLTRSVSDWDGLRRDPELWFENGDCLVHLYARGQSRRGPSFRVPFQALRESQCGALFSLCFAQVTPPHGSASSSPASRRVSLGLTTGTSPINTCEIYIPAPEDASREASFQWHITTRNFFAFIFNKPLVGTHLGRALVNLQERMHLFRSGQVDNHEDFVGYTDEQGYRDFVGCPDYALAMLFYAEHYQLREIWIDAFAHCAGQYGELSTSSEYEPTSRLTKALIMRASLEIDIHLGRVSVALTNFLENDLSSTFLGLPDGARSHLDRFRSFMHSFYVEKFGYWPPPRGSTFSKSLYRSMYYDMRSLYDYLVDRDSSIDLTSQKPASGGICVLQNVQAFDERHNFMPLPQPLPLIPQTKALPKRIQSQKALRALALGSKQAKTDRYMTTRAALMTATNSRDVSVTSNPIVQAYMRFERQCALSHQREEKVSMADARKVRWLLIYGTLQYLISALRSPKEVRNTQDPTYPLCCLVTEVPWHTNSRDSDPDTTHPINVPEAIDNYLHESISDTNQESDIKSTPTIQPDCQTDDYFTHTNQDPTPASSRPISVEVPAPLRLKSPSRRSSIRSFKSVTLSALNSRRNSLTSKSTPPSLPEIVTHGHGNGSNGVVAEQPSHRLPRSESAVDSRLVSNLGVGQARTPIFDSVQMDQLVSPVTPDDQSTVPSCSDSTTTADSPFWSDGASSMSSKSSASVDLACSNQNAIEESGLLGGLVSVCTLPKSTPRRPSSSKSTPCSHRGEFQFTFESSNVLDLERLDSSEGIRTSFEGTMDIGVALSGSPSVVTSSSNLSPAATPPATEQQKTTPKQETSRQLTNPQMTTNGIGKVMPSTGRRREKPLDIFSALSLGPSESRDKTSIATPRSTKESIAAEHPQSVKDVSSTKIANEAERGRKKDRRRSLALLLRQR